MDFFKLMAASFEDDDIRDPNKEVGMKLTAFPKINRLMGGMQRGFYVIAAAPHVGKTLFSVCLFNDLIQSNPDATGLYFSLDDSKTTIGYRLMSAHAGIPKMAFLTPKKPFEGKDVSKLVVETRAWLQTLQPRLSIFDLGDNITEADIENEVKLRADQGPTFVFVDGLANLETGRTSLRDQAERRAIFMKTVVDRFQIPIVSTHEVRKQSQERMDSMLTMDDVKETGKFAYNADAIWLLDRTGAGPTPQSYSVRLNMAKNKISDSREHIDLIMDTSTGQAREVVKAQSRMGSR